CPIQPEPIATVCPRPTGNQAQDHGPSDPDDRRSRTVDSSPKRPLVGASKLTDPEVDRAKDLDRPKWTFRNRVEAGLVPATGTAGRIVAIVGRWSPTLGMGAWGPGIFSSDTACDVRMAYRLALEDGLDDQAAQQQILDEFAEILNDDTWHDGPLVWLALA